MARNEKAEDGKSMEIRPRNWTVSVLLLCLREWNSYGYELMARASAFGFGVLSTPTTYRALRQMEKEGTVESGWETPKEGPARRVYSITDAGMDYLDLWADSLERYRRMMDAFFMLYAGRPLRPDAEQAVTKQPDMEDNVGEQKGQGS